MAGQTRACPICGIEVSIFGYKTHCRNHVAKGEATLEGDDFKPTGTYQAKPDSAKKDTPTKKDPTPKAKPPKVAIPKVTLPEVAPDGAKRAFDFIANRHFYDITNCWAQADLDVFAHPQARIVSPYLGVAEEELSRSTTEKYLNRFLASVLAGECAQFQRIKPGRHYKILYPKGQYYEIVTFAVSDKEAARLRADAKQALKRSLAATGAGEDDLGADLGDVPVEESEE